MSIADDLHRLAYGAEEVKGSIDSAIQEVGSAKIGDLDKKSLDEHTTKLESLRSASSTMERIVMELDDLSADSDLR